MPGLSIPLGVLRFYYISFNKFDICSILFRWRLSFLAKKSRVFSVLLKPKNVRLWSPYPWIGKPPGGWYISEAPKPPTLLRNSIGWLRRMFWESFLDIEQKDVNRGTSIYIHIIPYIITLVPNIPCKHFTHFPSNYNSSNAVPQCNPVAALKKRWNQHKTSIAGR